MELYCQAWGEPSSDLRLALFHGMGGTARLWRAVAALWEKKARVLAFDQRGHGQSLLPEHSPPALSEVTPEAYGRDVLESLEALKEPPLWGIGHSMGVRTLLAAAYFGLLENKSPFRGLVCVDLGLEGPAGGGLGESLSRFLQKLPKGFTSRAEARSFMETHSPDSSMSQYLMAVLGPDHQFPFQKEVLLKTIEAVRGVSFRPWVEALGQAKMPILFLRGGRSGVWSREEFNEEQMRFSKFSSFEFVEIPDTGHGLPFEKRNEFHQLVNDWIQNLLNA